MFLGETPNIQPRHHSSLTPSNRDKPPFGLRNTSFFRNTAGKISKLFNRENKGAISAEVTTEKLLPHAESEKMKNSLNSIVKNFLTRINANNLVKKNKLSKIDKQIKEAYIPHLKTEIESFSKNNQSLKDKEEFQIKLLKKRINFCESLLQKTSNAEIKKELTTIKEKLVVSKNIHTSELEK
jgi:hypothetical protein